MKKAGRPNKYHVELTEAQIEELQRMATQRKDKNLAFRSKIVLKSFHEKLPGVEIARQLRTAQHTVVHWRKRFALGGLNALGDLPRPGAPREITDAKVEEVIKATIETKPNGATHWSTRSLAKKMGMSQTAISRIWRAFGLRPHRSETFQLSTDPPFYRKGS